MALSLPVTDIGHERFLKVPWVGGPETHEDVFADHPGQLSIELCSPFHGDYIGGKVSQKDLNRLEAIGNRKSNKALAKARDEWLVQRDAAAKAGDSPFWGPSAFQAPCATNSLAVTPLHQLIWRQSMSTSSTSETSHFSGQLGMGGNYAGCKLLHLSGYCATLWSGNIMLTATMEPLTTEARQLLREYGPEAFETMFGTHFVSGFVIGCESGYCISMQTDKRDERDEFSLIAEIHFLFWSVSVETKLAEKVETSLKMKPTITSYDTLEAIFEQSGIKDDLTADSFAESSMEIRQRIKSLKARVATAKAAEKLDRLILEIVVSPWAALKEWHEGCADWRANVHRK
ncbi:hypothetical protein FGADI_12329 [Fusarium gaditjirri]|uniref:Uncharacterized protein n=1 Tax=Fusarium gaditjirri TaxID=282569 RepID=A0A8H4SSH0_9HYPO|nr:hypothetical protein FGADI_12329 [Fusarium gaditjirri]